MFKLPISAVVVTSNEGHLLENCLSSVSFCQEIITIDLESEDNSFEIAKKYATIQLSHPKSLAVEPIRHWISSKTRFDWILFIDPDEKIDINLKEEIISIFNKLEDNIGMISVPWQFYFLKHRLKGTFWGIINMQKTILINKLKVSIPLGVHEGYVLNPHFNNLFVIYKDNNVLHHFWMSSHKNLYLKHLRYLKIEGKKKYDLGIKYNLKKQYKNFATSFYDSFIIFKGYKDGFLGLFLSLFFAWYNFQIWNSLKKYRHLNENPS